MRATLLQPDKGPSETLRCIFLCVACIAYTMPDLTDEDIQFIRDLREKHEDGKVNRRQALGMLGAAGVGAAGGFLGTGSAAADPSTSDSDGNVGLPSDRVDVFAEGIDSNSVSANTGTITSLDGTDMQYDVVTTDEVNTDRYIGPGDGDPLQIIADYISNNAQNAYKFTLEPGNYSTSTTLDIGNDQTNIGQNTPIFIEGRGGQEKTANGTFIDCSSLGAGVPAIRENGTTTKARVHLRNFALSDANLSSWAIESTQGIVQWELSGVSFDGFAIQLRTKAQVIRTKFDRVFSRDGQFIEADNASGTGGGWNVNRFSGLIIKSSTDPAMRWNNISHQTLDMHGDAANCAGTLFQMNGDGGSSKSLDIQMHLEGMNTGAGVPIFDFDFSGAGRVEQGRFRVNETGTAGGDFLRVQGGTGFNSLVIENTELGSGLGGLFTSTSGLLGMKIANSRIGCDIDFSGVGWVAAEGNNFGGVVTWPSTNLSENKSIGGGYEWSGYEPRPSTPPVSVNGLVYLDDGTNTASGNYGFRAYNGTSWVDL